MMARWALLLHIGIFGCTARGEVLTPRAEDSNGRVPAVGLDIASGQRHACASATDGLHCWGANDQGQLGTGDDVSSALPRLVLGIGIGHLLQVAAGAEHNCALDDLGTVYCWGGNDRGQLGIGDRSLRRAPTEVALAERATAITTKFRHSCALMASGRLYCWGQNWEGQLGQVDLPPTTGESAADALLPMVVGDATWSRVDAGDGHTCGIRLDGGLWCWGRNSEHELGADSRIQVREPVLATSDGPWMDVTAGQNFTCAIRGDQSLWCWGQNTGSGSGSGYPLGILDATELASPSRVDTATEWVAIRGHTFHSCATRRNLDLWCWGRNIEGQLGTADIEARATPTQVRVGIALVSPGSFATCAISKEGVALCTGKNEVGQLGTGDTERRREFTAIQLSNP